MSDISIRPALAADLERIVAIMCDDPVPDLRGVVGGNVERARRVGALLVRNGLEIDLASTVLAVDGGQRVGLLERRRPGDAAHSASGKATAAVLRAVIGTLLVVGPAAPLRYARYQRARARIELHRPDGAYYIGEIDVHPVYRNRGIGAELMRFAEAEARVSSFRTMALSTGITNPAQHLYRRCGFETVEQRRDATYERLTGVPGRMLMVKQLD